MKELDSESLQRALDEACPPPATFKSVIFRDDYRDLIGRLRKVRENFASDGKRMSASEFCRIVLDMALRLRGL